MRWPIRGTADGVKPSSTRASSSPWSCCRTADERFVPLPDILQKLKRCVVDTGLRPILQLDDDEGTIGIDRKLISLSTWSRQLGPPSRLPGSLYAFACPNDLFEPSSLVPFCRGGVRQDGLAVERDPRFYDPGPVRLNAAFSPGPAGPHDYAVKVRRERAGRRRGRPPGRAAIVRGSGVPPPVWRSPLPR